MKQRTLWVLFVFVVLLIAVVTTLVFIMLNKKEVASKGNESNAVCMTRLEYDNLLMKSQLQQQQPPAPPSRDMQVLTNPLHPPLNRSETPTHNSLRNEVEARNLYVPTTRDNLDRFRLVGYLTSKDATSSDSGGNNWKLFARQKDRHSAEFYIIPANNNYDIKVMLTDDVVKGTRLRDTYTIPNELSFNNPLLNKTPYEFVEIPKTDFTTTPQVYL
jgi:hypothetical protein